MLEIKDLMVFYENAIAINNIKMRCPKGRVTGVFGANSAGKSTLIKLLAGIHPHGAAGSHYFLRFGRGAGGSATLGDRVVRAATLGHREGSSSHPEVRRLEQFAALAGAKAGGCFVSRAFGRHLRFGGRWRRRQ